MGLFINKGNDGFQQSRNGEYVDKSGLIGFMNSVLNTEHQYVCVTRARRFGKTIAAKMLYAYYDKSCDSRALFEDLEIATDPTFEQHLNKYPAIYLDMTDFTSRGLSPEDFVATVEKTLCRELQTVWPDIQYSDASSLPFSLVNIAQSTGEKFIFIIDEWDAPLREFKGNDVVEKEWVGLLRSMFKSATVQTAFAGVYITGILPIVRYNTQSALNNFQEYNLITPKVIGKYLGFTEEDVKNLCEKHHMPFEQMEAWYDGYQLGRMGHIFNPNSVMSAIRNREFLSYWAATGAGNELVPYLRYELREDVQLLLAGESIYVDTYSFDNRLGDIDTRDKLFTALIHLGYLSYDGRKARIPNLELMLYFGSSIKRANLGGLTHVLSRSEEVLDSILAGKSDRVAALLALSHDDICGAQEYNSEQGLYTTLRESLFFAHQDYIFHREYPSGKGFADLVLIPRPGHNLPALVVELKYDKDAASAIDQIKERNYPAKIQEYSGEVLLVGVNYDKDTKEHQCSIESFSNLL